VSLNGLLIPTETAVDCVYIHQHRWYTCIVRTIPSRKTSLQPCSSDLVISTESIKLVWIPFGAKFPKNTAARRRRRQYSRNKSNHRSKHFSNCCLSNFSFCSNYNISNNNINNNKTLQILWRYGLQRAPPKTNGTTFSANEVNGDNHSCPQTLSFVILSYFNYNCTEQWKYTWSCWKEYCRHKRRFYQANRGLCVALFIGRCSFSPSHLPVGLLWYASQSYPLIMLCTK